ncbi:hypothetical protein EDF24_2662 [Curtobacterium sp. PhB130]|nr:hypothetical protein EDF24_2662 [Curtobacterium sp. PhB130]
MSLVDIDELTKDFPRFSTLMGGYFNYDWRDDHESAEAVYDEALKRMPRSRVEQLGTELRVIASAFTTDERVQTVLDTLDTSLDPALDTGLSPVAWLEQLRAYVDRDLAELPGPQDPAVDVSNDELALRTPRIVNLLAAYFNYDWNLDHPDVEAVYADAFDDLPPESRRAYLDQARSLQAALDDDDAVKEYLRYVGTGLSPMLDLGMTPGQWLDALVARLERGL